MEVLNDLGVNVDRILAASMVIVVDVIAPTEKQEGENDSFLTFFFPSYFRYEVIKKQKKSQLWFSPNKSERMLDIASLSTQKS